MGNDFPKLGIKTQDLLDEMDRLLKEAEEHSDEMGAVNWGDLGVADIEYVISILDLDEGPRCVVVVEEASPDSKLADWLYERLDKTRFPNTYIECEW